jgi:zinc protease
MKRIYAPLLSILLLAVAAPLCAQAPWTKIPIPPLTAFHPQEPKRIQLPNGMVIFLQPDHELPLISATARIRGGSRAEPADKTGMLDIYGEVWRTGGTKAQTGDQLDDYLEVRAAKVETDSDADSTFISLDCLKADFDDVFKVFNELLREPEFRADKLVLAQKEYYDNISRRNDNVGGIAARESTMLAYGKENPYAREAQYATVAAVTRLDLVNWHHQAVQPNNIIFGITGDFDPAAMEAKLRQAFESWPKGPAWKAPDITLHPAKPGYYLINKNDVNQSNIRMVALGTTRDNPDYYAIEVFNEAFGGSFASRLFRGVRTAKGLAYGVGGGIGTAYDHPGILRFSVGTKSGTTVEAIDAVYEEVDKLKTDPISDSEIKTAKDSILNSFVFNLDSPEKVLRERMAYEFYGYPPDFMERYRAGVDKVTKADVAGVAAKYVHKDQLAVLVVGKTSDFDKPLSTLGAVTPVDISIPPPPGQNEETPKPAASNPAGKALVAKVVAALGGQAKLDSIKSVRAEIALTQKTPNGDLPMNLQTIIVFPDKMHAEIQGPMGSMTLVATPGSAFVSMAGMGVRDMPSEQKAETLTQIKRDLIYIGQHAADPAFIFAPSGSEKIGNVDASILDITGDGVNLRWYVDPKTGRVLREDYPSLSQSGPVQAETDLEDWQTIDGLTLPYMHKNKQNGQDSSTAEYKKFEINPTLDSRLFDKPAVEANSAQ